MSEELENPYHPVDWKLNEVIAEEKITFPEFEIPSIDRKASCRERV